MGASGAGHVPQQGLAGIGDTEFVHVSVVRHPNAAARLGGRSAPLRTPLPDAGLLGAQRRYMVGSFRDSLDGDTFETLNPTTNEVLAVACSGGVLDVEAAVIAARRAFDVGPWPRMAAAERAKVLERVADLIRG